MKSVEREPLKGTTFLRDDGDMAAAMVSGIRAYLVELTESTKRKREHHLGRLTVEEIQKRRSRLAEILGVVDECLPIESFELLGTLDAPAQIASCEDYVVYRVRWPALEGVEGEGYLLKPSGIPHARVIAIPDASWTPESVAGLRPGGSPFGAQLARLGCEVIVPVLINRDNEWSGNPEFAMTNQTHREFAYRMAYEMGRHVIGYEIQKLLAVVDHWANQGPQPIGVFGYGEGGMLAFYAAAIDPRLDVVGVSGFFGDRFKTWQHPIDRNVWGLLKGFSDAEVVQLIAPRPLIVEASAGPIESPPKPIPEYKSPGRSASPGVLTAIPVEEAEAEGRLAQSVYQECDSPENFTLIAPPLHDGAPDRKQGSPDAIAAFCHALGVKTTVSEVADLDGVLPSTAPLPDPSLRQRRQLHQLIQFTQRLMHLSPKVRKRFFWDHLDLSSLEKYQEARTKFRTILWNEVIGRLPELPTPGPAQSRLVQQDSDVTIYEVKLPLNDHVFAFGALLLPNDLKPGERRPVVVCQHGLEARPAYTYQTDPIDEAFGAFSKRLAERGYVVYAPQNPYIGGHAFRVLQRLANPLGLSLFSFIIEQHQRALEWLADQPFVDPDRIAFYGISYGGKTAMRVPSLLDGYCLSICSADFNEWIFKNVSYDLPFSYIYMAEYEMPEFNLGHTFNYAEMAALIAPKPFMVERGSKDGVGWDEYVAFEYAKVRRLYADLGIADQTKMAIFNGGHKIDGTETFPFLDQKLGWKPVGGN